MFGFVIEYNKSVVGFTICEATPIFTSEARAQSSVANWKSACAPVRSVNINRLNFEFFYKLRKNAFGIFPICSDGFGSRYACINSGAPHFN